MTYTDSSGKTHVSLSEAASGHAAKTTASRSASGTVVGTSIGSQYVKAQEAAASASSGGTSAGTSTTSDALKAAVAEEAASKAAEAVAASKKTVTLKEAASGQAAKTTASRDTTGAIVGTSTGSKYAKAQEAAKKAAEQKAAESKSSAANLQTSTSWDSAIKSGAYASAVTDKATAQTASQSSDGTVSGLSNILKAGYSAGRTGELTEDLKDTSLVKYGDLYTRGFYEYTEGLSSQIDTLQNKLLGKLPVTGVTKGFVTGITNVPEIAVSTIGGVALGTESLLRNRSSALPAVALGLGIMAGSVVTEAKEEPATLAGELIGTIAAGKVAGKVSSKVRTNVASGRSLLIDESAELRPSLKFAEKVTNAKTTKVAEPEAYVEVGGQLVKQSDYKISSIGISEDVVLTPEMERVLFGYTTKVEPEPVYEIKSVTIGKDVTLTPEMERVLFGSSGELETITKESAVVKPVSVYGTKQTLFGEMRVTPEKTIAKANVFERSTESKVTLPTVNAGKYSQMISASDLLTSAKSTSKSVGLTQFSGGLLINTPSIAFSQAQQVKQRERESVFIIPSISVPQVTKQKEDNQTILIPSVANVLISSPQQTTAQDTSLVPAETTPTETPTPVPIINEVPSWGGDGGGDNWTDIPDPFGGINDDIPTPYKLSLTTEPEKKKIKGKKSPEKVKRTWKNVFGTLESASAIMMGAMTEEPRVKRIKSPASKKSNQPSSITQPSQNILFGAVTVERKQTTRRGKKMKQESIIGIPDVLSNGTGRPVRVVGRKRTSPIKIVSTPNEQSSISFLTGR